MSKNTSYFITLSVGIFIGFAIGLTMDPLDRAIRKAQQINRTSLRGVDSLRKGGNFNLFGILKKEIPLAEKITTDPSFSNSYVNNLNQNIAKKEEAIAELSNANEFIDLATKKVFIDSSLKLYQVSLGQIQLKNGFLYDAISNLESAYQKSPKDSSIAQLLSTAYLGLYQILPDGSERASISDNAIKFLKITLKTKPNSIQTLYNLGLIYTDQGVYDQALPLFLQVIKLDPENIDALLGVARIYYDQGQIDKSRQIYEQTEALILEIKNKRNFIRRNINYGLLDQKLRVIRQNLEIIYSSNTIGR